MAHSTKQLKLSRVFLASVLCVCVIVLIVGCEERGLSVFKGAWKMQRVHEHRPGLSMTWVTLKVKQDGTASVHMAHAAGDAAFAKDFEVIGRFEVAIAEERSVILEPTSQTGAVEQAEYVSKPWHLSKIANNPSVICVRAGDRTLILEKSRK